MVVGGSSVATDPVPSSRVAVWYDLVRKCSTGQYEIRLVLSPV